MKRFVPFLLALAGLCGGVLFLRGLDRYAYAQGMADAPITAIDAGPPPAVAPTVTVTAPATSDIAVTPQAPTVDAETHVIVAPPDGSTQPSTPVAVDASFWSRVEALWRSGSLGPAVLLALYGLLVLARAKVPRLRSGKAAAYSAMGVTALATLLEPALRGTTPSLAMIISAVTGAVLLSTSHPPKGAATAGGTTAAGEVGQ